MYLRQFPEGPVIGFLREGDPLIVLYGSRLVNGIQWVEVQDAEGRVGWLPEVYLAIVTLTPTATSSAPSGTPAPLNHPPSPPSPVTASPTP